MGPTSPSELGPGERDSKRRAVQAFQSQIRPLGHDPKTLRSSPHRSCGDVPRDYEVYVVGDKGR